MNMVYKVNLLTMTPMFHVPHREYSDMLFYEGMSGSKSGHVYLYLFEDYCFMYLLQDSDHTANLLDMFSMRFLIISQHEVCKLEFILK